MFNSSNIGLWIIRILKIIFLFFFRECLNDSAITTCSIDVLDLHYSQGINIVMFEFEIIDM